MIHRWTMNDVLVDEEVQGVGKNIQRGQNEV